jgi:hypothetical protein
MVKINIPACVGEPVICPDVESINPGGSEPLLTLKVNVPEVPLAVTVWLYGAPTVPSGNVSGFTVMAGQLIAIE